MSIPDSTLIALWARAVQAPIGISIQIDDRKWLIYALYRLRRTIRDPAWDRLSIFSPASPADEVFICHKEASKWMQS